MTTQNSTIAINDIRNDTAREEPPWSNKDAILLILDLGIHTYIHTYRHTMCAQSCTLTCTHE